MSKKWMQHAFKKHAKGALHRQLGVPMDKKIPVAKLQKVKRTPVGKKVCGVRVTRLLKRRVVLALNARKAKRK